MSGLELGRSGSEQYTADNAVGPSGQPIRLWAVNMLSGGTAGQLVLRDGTADTDTIWDRDWETLLPSSNPLISYLLG